MWFNNIFKALTATSSRRRATRRPAARLDLEPLEDRRLLSFSPAVNYTVGDGPQAVATADFNRDGRPDLAVGQLFSSYVNVLLGNGNGTFAAPVSIDIGEYIGSRLSAVTVGDFNGDGKTDLAAEDFGVPAPARVAVLLGTGSGALGRRPIPRPVIPSRRGT